MDKLKITGGKKLSGTVNVSGAKNAALPILISSILTSEKLYISNVPDLRDINTTKRLLEHLGLKVQQANNIFTLSADQIKNYEAPYELVKTMRASILVLGPLLARFGSAHVSLPGGCSIGARPVDLHINALEKMGAKINIHNGYIEASTSHQGNRLKGTKIFMDLVTVTGTENIMMAATLAEGETIIENAAKEPEIEDLGNLLNKMGADIKGLGTGTLTINGVKELKGTSHEVMFDRIEAGTFMVAAAVTQGEVLIKNISEKYMQAVIEKIIASGATVSITSNGCMVKGSQKIKSVDVRTGPYPFFPTDMQAQLMMLNTMADGTAEIVETIFENRFMHVQELIRMGANIDIHGNTSVVRGVNCLEGAEVMATDLRASACLVLAGLAADGITIIDRIYHLDRGYEHIENKLNMLGAQVERIN